VRKPTRWILTGVGGLAGVLLLAAAAVYLASSRRANQTITVAPESITLPDDSLSLTNGERLANMYGCTECHGRDLGGTMLVDEPVFLTLAAPNLTAGAGGVGRTYTPADHERALRHGVSSTGRPLMIMPSAHYNHLSNQDVAEILTYVTHVPPVDRAWGPPRLGPAGRMASLMQGPAIYGALAIDHTKTHVDRVDRAESVAYGRYLATACAGCHQPDFHGGPVPAGPPDSPPAANMTPHETDGIGRWTLADFERAIRRGQRPDGSVIDSQSMPWPYLSRMTDVELRSIWMFLRTLAPLNDDGE